MKSRLVIVLLLLFTGFACKDVREKLLPSFTVNIPPIQLAIPPIPLVLKQEIPVGALKTPINLDSTIKARTANMFGADAVHSVKVSKVVLNINNADANNNLSNFQSARIRIFSDTSFTDIAVITFPTIPADRLEVRPPQQVDISSYLKGKFLSYNLYWQNRKATTRRLKLNVTISLDVQ